MGVIDSIQICRNYAEHTANFTAPTAKHAYDFATVLLVNFDANDGIFIGANAGLGAPQPCQLLFQSGDDTLTFGSGGGADTEVGHMMWQGGGIRAIASINLDLHDLDFLFARAGVLAFTTTVTCLDSPISTRPPVAPSR